MRTDHDGDCTIYASIIEGKHIECTDGICTCGYGWEQVRKGDWSKMFSYDLKEREAKDTRLTDAEIESIVRKTLAGDASA